MTAPGTSMQAAYAGLLAASNAVVNRQLSRGGFSAAAALPPRFRPSSLDDLPRLVSGDEPGQRLPRATAVALLKSLEREQKGPYAAPTGPAGALITNDERVRLERSGNVAPRSACRYCSMFEELFHGQNVKLCVVNHGATIQTSFDDQTSVSRAAIADYQMFVPQRLAGSAINRNHPLFWAEAAPEFFDATGPAEALGHSPDLRFRLAEEALTDPAAIGRWEAQARQAANMCERARFPFNENITTRVDNAIRIEGFADGIAPGGHSEAAHQRAFAAGGDQSLTERIARELAAQSEPLRKPNECRPSDTWDESCDRVQRYDFSLELCMRSSYGIGWEDYNGLNIDDGSVNAIAIRYSRILPEHVANLRPQDLFHLATALARRAHKAADQVAKLARDSVDVKPSARADLNARAVRLAGEAFESLWHTPPWLLGISSSKRLRYALPTNNPVELWSAMTWMAPALLFTFMNRAVCQLPHLLLDEAH